MKRALVSSEVYRSPWLTLREDQVLHDDGTVAPFAVVTRSDSVVIICQLADGGLVMTEQYRYACARWSVELPQGSVLPGESLAAAAVRELREETGWIGADAEVLSERLFEAGDWATQGFAVVRVRAIGRGASGLEREETGLRAFAVPAHQLASLHATGRLTDAATLAALYLHSGLSPSGGTTPRTRRASAANDDVDEGVPCGS